MERSDSLVTVVIPAWDSYATHFLGDALTSLEGQVPAPHIVIVDNASRPAVQVPGDAELVRAPGRLTLGAARNLGLQAVRTPYVMFWDADDLMPSGALAALASSIRQAPEAVLASGNIVETPSKRRHHWPRRSTRRLAGAPTLFALVHCVSSLFPTVGVLVETQAARDAGGFPDADAGDDWIFGVSLAFRGRVVFVDSETRLYTAHERSVSFGWGSSQIAANARGVRQRLRNDPGIPKWARSLWPVIGFGQLMVIFGVRPVARLTRSLVRRLNP